MNNEEIDKELGLSYDKLCKYLLKKYGPAEHDYFINESCRSRNKKVSRTDEGLLCHHIDEDKSIKLSDPGYAIMKPFDYQKAERLVYCNALEHLILHIKIAEKVDNFSLVKGDPLGIGGAIVHIIPGLNLCYSGYQYKRPHDQNVYGKIVDNFDGYIRILKYLIEHCGITSKLILSFDLNRKKVKRVYDALN